MRNFRLLCAIAYQIRILGAIATFEHISGETFRFGRTLQHRMAVIIAAYVREIMINIQTLELDFNLMRDVVA